MSNVDQCIISMSLRFYKRIAARRIWQNYESVDQPQVPHPLWPIIVAENERMNGLISFIVLWSLAIDSWLVGWQSHVCAGGGTLTSITCRCQVVELLEILCYIIIYYISCLAETTFTSQTCVFDLCRYISSQLYWLLFNNGLLTMVSACMDTNNAIFLKGWLEFFVSSVCHPHYYYS